MVGGSGSGRMVLVPDVARIRIQDTWIAYVGANIEAESVTGPEIEIVKERDERKCGPSRRSSLHAKDVPSDPSPSPLPLPFPRSQRHRAERSGIISVDMSHKQTRPITAHVDNCERDSPNNNNTALQTR